MRAKYGIGGAEGTGAEVSPSPGCPSYAPPGRPFPWCRR